ncbi:MAG TPA: CopD family protein [Dongiaceae bacterium]|nr:CopD family protein [Dongiaceae bacterium]
MTGAELLLGLARGTHVAATMSVFGSMWFRAVLLGPAPVASSSAGSTSPGAASAPQQAWEKRLLRWTRLSVLLALLAVLPWLVLQAASLADEPSFSEIAATIPVVLLQTHFGPLIGARLALLLIACLLFRAKSRRGTQGAATACAGLAVLLQVGLGHGLSMEDGTRIALIAAETFHLLTAAIWLGGLLPLLFAVQTLPPRQAFALTRRFSHLAMLCVAVLAITIVVQSWFLIGGVPDFIGTDYGGLASLKALFFLALLGCAALNRWRFMPRLAGTDAALAQRRLRRSIAFESMIGLLVILAAGTLLTLAPAIHQQPDWPFAYRFSLETASDPDLRAEILLGTMQATAAFLCLCLCVALIWWHRTRLLRWGPRCVLGGGLGATAILLAWFASYHLDLLLVPAYPTSFYTSPTGFTGASIVSGAKLFADNCTACHGAAGRGDGPQAKGMAIAPADLTAEHLFGHSDGELFWWLSHGIAGPDGNLVMPGFAAQLDDDDRWALIDYIRAHNAGLAMHATGQWPQPMAAPDMTVTWQDMAMPLSSLHGHFLLLIAAGDKTPPVPPSGTTPAVTSFTIDPQSDAWNAYAVMAGISPDQLAGTQFLVDDNGWLRAVLYPSANDWADAARVAKALQDAVSHPLAASGGSHHHHAS